MSGKAGFSDNESGNAHGFAPWEGINTAFSWLTILPFPGATTFDRTTGARAMAALPLVGVFLGVCTYAFTMVADALSISPLLTAVLIVVLWETLTRMMHLDGLADVGDALGSFQSGEQAQKILADRYTGALGMGTVLLTLLTQVAAIHALLTTSALLTVAALPAIGRCAAMITCARGFTAFSPTGFGVLVIGTIRWWWIGVWALMLAAALYYEVWILGITALVGTLLFNLLVAAHFRRRFGGLNGDCIGASIELCTAFSAALVAVLL